MWELTRAVIGGVIGGVNRGIVGVGELLQGEQLLLVLTFEITLHGWIQT